MWFEERLHPVLARHYPPEKVNGSRQFRDVIRNGFDGLGRTGELLDLVELIDNSMENWQTPDSKNFVDKVAGPTLDQKLASDDIFMIMSFMLVIQRHNSKQQSVPPPPGFNLDDSHWQKIEQLAITNLGSNSTWMMVIAEIPGPREKCVNAINAIVNLNQFHASLMSDLCKAIVNHCESNAHVLLEYLLSTNDSVDDDNDCAKALAEIGYWRHITLLQEVGANGLAEKLRFRLIANGSSYIESIHNSEFKEEEINREIMALQNEELRAEKMQQTPQLAMFGEMKGLLLEILERKNVEQHITIRDSVVMGDVGNIEQPTKQESTFDLDLDL
jgi:hypothetical protein